MKRHEAIISEPPESLSGSSKLPRVLNRNPGLFFHAVAAEGLGIGQLSESHLGVMEKEYESLRRRKAYREPRLIHRFLLSDLAPFLKSTPRRAGFRNKLQPGYGRGGGVPRIRKPANQALQDPGEEREGLPFLDNAYIFDGY